MTTPWDRLPNDRKLETITDLRDAVDALAQSTKPLPTSPAAPALVRTIEASYAAGMLSPATSTSEQLIDAIRQWNNAAAMAKAALPAAAWFSSPYANNDTLRWAAALAGPVDVGAMASASDISIAASTWAHLLPEVNATTGAGSDFFKAFATKWSREPVTTAAQFKRTRMLQSSLDGEMQSRRAVAVTPGHGAGTGGALPIVTTPKPMDTGVVAAVVVASVAGVALIAAVSWSILRNKKGEFKRPSRPPPPLGEVHRAGRGGR